MASLYFYLLYFDQVTKYKQAKPKANLFCLHTIRVCPFRALSRPSIACLVQQVLLHQTMAAKRNASGLSALPRPSLDNEELVSPAPILLLSC